MGDIADLTAKAYEIARMIPYGRVTSYGELLLWNTRYILMLLRTYCQTRRISPLPQVSNSPNSANQD